MEIKTLGEKLVLLKQRLAETENIRGKNNELLCKIEKSVERLAELIGGENEEKKLIEELAKEIGSVGKETAPSTPQRAHSTQNRMALLTEDEFAKTPQYMRGRMALEKVNAIIEDINTVFDRKRETLNTPKEKMTLETKRRIAQYRETDCKEVAGSVYITEQNIKDAMPLPALKQNPSYKNTFSILRHHGRIREVRKGGVLMVVLL
ncbi:MAG: spindle and kinetochore-associated protein 1 [Amphiamblys sp. WSBS2006]|nr:MAG: spindle and kinetochore-associated protein 1 [Amphiamblys sp. WSBS2006]